MNVLHNYFMKSDRYYIGNGFLLDKSNLITAFCSELNFELSRGSG